MLSLWGLNLAIQDPSFIDTAWGMGFVLVAGIAALHSQFDPRCLLLLILTAAWGMRLSLHLFRRWRREGADERYVRFLRKVPIRNYPLATLVFVFGMQGTLMWIVSLPLQAAALAAPLVTPGSVHSNLPETLSFGVVNIAGLCIALAGMVMEAVADAQLSHFRSLKDSKSKVLNIGLWRYSRHPNYFGDAVFWWGLYFISIDTSRQDYLSLWSIAGPITMTYLLRYLSGVPLIDAKLKHTRPGYEDYMRYTSPFVPLPPLKAHGK